MRIYITLFLLFVTETLNAQSTSQSTPTTTTRPTTTTTRPTTTTTTPPNVPCISKYSPFMNGTCQTKESCTGATLLGLCRTTSYVCCVNDTDININYSDNKFIPLNVYRSLVGNSTRATALYKVFSRALTEANVTTCHQAAAFLSMIQGETSNLMLFHELLKDSSKFDFDANLGNNQTGDGNKFEGRGAILLRGRENYQLASNNTGNENL